MRPPCALAPGANAATAPSAAMQIRNGFMSLPPQHNFLDARCYRLEFTPAMKDWPDPRFPETPVSKAEVGFWLVLTALPIASFFVQFFRN